MKRYAHVLLREHFTHVRVQYVCILCVLSYTHVLHSFLMCGIKGASVFPLHFPFNMAKGFVVDNLHAVYILTVTCVGGSKGLLIL